MVIQVVIYLLVLAYLIAKIISVWKLKSNPNFFGKTSFYDGYEECNQSVRKALA